MLLSSFSFDSSVAGVFWALSCGGRLVIPDGDVRHDPKILVDAVTDSGVSHLLCVPSLYRFILDETDAESFEFRGAVILAGEACPTSLVDRHMRSRRGRPLFNEYGPTEATVWSSVFRCTPQESRAQVPIGHPISNVQIFVLDPSLQPVPVGVTGELNISGDGLSRGYLNRPDYTAAKFIPNPFSSSPGSRLYRSGDLARYNSLGRLHFLGRIDTQVKLRGFRIELAEIDALLALHPSVKDAVVSALPFAPDDLRLVAYIVPVSPNDSFSTSELRSFLLTRLPDFMIPAAFVVLDSLPLSPNGKVNRNALPPPQSLTPLLERSFSPPSSPLQHLLAAIWKDVLKLDALGIDNNFFTELGGHSLLATQMVSRVRTALDIDLPLWRLFDSPTIRDFANVILLSSDDQHRIEKTAQLLLLLDTMSEDEVDDLLLD